MTEIANHLIDAVKQDTLAVRLIVSGALFLMSLAIAMTAINAALKLFTKAFTDATTTIKATTSFVSRRSRLAAILMLVIFGLLLCLESSSTSAITRLSVLFIALLSGGFVAIAVYLTLDLCYFLTVRKWKREHPDKPKP